MRPRYDVVPSELRSRRLMTDRFRPPKSHSESPSATFGCSAAVVTSLSVCNNASDIVPIEISGLAPFSINATGSMT